MKIYKTTRHPWAYLIYGATQKQLAALDASRLFRAPYRTGRRAPQRAAECTEAARAVLLATGTPETEIPPAVSGHDWALADEENRAESLHGYGAPNY